MSRSIARAVQQDATALRAARMRENFEILDRENTFRMERIRAPNLPAPTIDHTDDTEDIVMARLATLNATSSSAIDLIPAS